MSSYTGHVVWFSSSKGFGFLAYDEGPDVFVHHKAVQVEALDCLNDGEPVEFETEPGADGKPQATRVRRLSSRH